eukprot:6187493-Pleurochrysis_carterae.AAC.2
MRDYAIWGVPAWCAAVCACDRSYVTECKNARLLAHMNPESRPGARPCMRACVRAHAPVLALPTCTCFRARSHTRECAQSKFTTFEQIRPNLLLLRTKHCRMKAEREELLCGIGRDDCSYCVALAGVAGSLGRYLGELVDEKSRTAMYAKSIERVEIVEKVAEKTFSRFRDCRLSLHSNLQHMERTPANRGPSSPMVSDTSSHALHTSSRVLLLHTTLIDNRCSRTHVHPRMSIQAFTSADPLALAHAPPPCFC